MGGGGGDHAVEGSYCPVLVPRDEPALEVPTVLRPGARDSIASWTREIEGVVAREIGATGRSFIGPHVFRSGGTHLFAHCLRDCLRAWRCMPWTVGSLAPGLAPLSSGNRLRRLVGLVEESLRSRLRLGGARGFGQWAPQALQPLFTLSSHVVGGAFAVPLAPTFPAEHKLREGQKVRPGSWAALGKAVPRGTRVERSSSRYGVSGRKGRSMRWETGLLKVGWQEQHGLVPVEAKREQTGQM